jgi:lysophospholipase L1-like esterase
MPGVKSAALASLFLLVFLGAACRPEVPNLDSPGTTIVCLGDSITAGVGAEPGHAYPDVLAARLGVPVINAGVPGDTTEGALARLDQVLAEDPWLVIVELGGNDRLRQVPPERTEAALRTILQRLLAARVVPVLVELDAPFSGSYNAIYGRLADELSIPMVGDVLREILMDPTLKSDPIHPNTRGHELLAEAVAETVAPLLAARREKRP